MKLTLQKAQEICGDDQAIQRKYITEEVIEMAAAIADEVVAADWFGKDGYGSAVGCPYEWWYENVAAYRAADVLKSRQFSNCEKLAEYMIASR